MVKLTRLVAHLITTENHNVNVTGFESFGQKFNQYVRFHRVESYHESNGRLDTPSLLGKAMLCNPRFVHDYATSQKDQATQIFGVVRRSRQQRTES